MYQLCLVGVNGVWVWGYLTKCARIMEPVIVVPQQIFVGPIPCWSLARAVFSWVSKVVSHLLWFYIALLWEWLKNLAPLSQPIRSKTGRVFPRLALVKCVRFDSDWFIGLSATLVIGQSDEFGSGFMTLNWKRSHYNNNWQ